MGPEQIKILSGLKFTGEKSFQNGRMKIVRWYKQKKITTLMF